MGLDLADVIEDVRAEVNSITADIFTDLCSLVVSASVPDGFGGTTETDTVLASGVPCEIEALSSPMQITIGGAGLTSLTHKIRMGADAITKNIRPHYKIVAEPHHDILERTFENPVTLDGSFDVFITVAAVLSE